MLDRFQIHNSFKNEFTNFYEFDPHLKSLANQKLQHKPQWCPKREEPSMEFNPCPWLIFF